MKMHRLTTLAMVLLGTISAAAAHAAGATATGSLLAIPLVTPIVRAGYPPDFRNDAIGRYPRVQPYRPYAQPQPTRPRGFLMLNAGVFDPEENVAEHTTFGFRAGQAYDLLSVGVAADWAHKSFDEEIVIAQTVDPTGHVVTQAVQTMHTSSHLVPMLVFMQITAPQTLPIRPYFGVGGGYELLFLSSHDYINNVDYDANFGGWGWQAWGGASLKLGPRSALIGEIFANNATVSRDVGSFSSGQPIRESVNANGVGARFGIQFGY